MRRVFSLANSAREQSEANPADWESTYRQMVLFDLAADIELGFFLAYYRNFAIPSIAATLQRNGEIIERPMKRSYDTAIVTYELITNGLNSDRGRHMIHLLNHAHRQVPESQTDVLYVLLTLLVVPIRRARAHTWRAPTPAEETAATRFCQELGARMNIAGTPTTFQDAEKFFDRYERDNIAYSPAGAELMAGTLQVLKTRLPALARPLTRPMLSAMFDDDHLTDALGLPRRSDEANGGEMRIADSVQCWHGSMSSTPSRVQSPAGSRIRTETAGPGRQEIQLIVNANEGHRLRSEHVGYYKPFIGYQRLRAPLHQQGAISSCQWPF